MARECHPDADRSQRLSRCWRRRPRSSARWRGPARQTAERRPPSGCRPFLPTVRTGRPMEERGTGLCVDAQRLVARRRDAQVGLTRTIRKVRSATTSITRSQLSRTSRKLPGSHKQCCARRLRQTVGDFETGRTRRGPGILRQRHPYRRRPALADLEAAARGVDAGLSPPDRYRRADHRPPCTLRTNVRLSHCVAIGRSDVRSM